MQKVDLTSTSPLFYNPTGLKRTYGVIFDLANGEKKLHVHFEVVIKYLGKLQDQYLLIEMDKKDVFINNQMPENTIDQFTAACGAILYPLEVITSSHGEFLGINNKKAIRERWEEKKPKLQQYYKGEKAEEIFTYMDLALGSDHHLVNSVFEDQFVALYFSKAIAISHKIGLETFEISIPGLPYTRAVKYEIKQETDGSPTDNGTIQLLQKGHCTDERDQIDPGKGEVNLRYSLYRKDHTINSITGSFDLFTKGTLRAIQVQVYHLREKDEAGTAALQDNKQEEKKVEKKRRSFFSFLD